jgi:hypothetical protein
MSFGFGFFGLAFLAMGLVIYRKDLRSWRNAVHTGGIVEDRVFMPGRSRPSHVIVRYTAQDGVAREASVGLPEEHGQIKIGDPIEIVYDPADLRVVRRAATHDPNKRPRPNSLVALGSLFLTAAVIFTIIGI